MSSRAHAVPSYLTGHMHDVHDLYTAVRMNLSTQPRPVTCINMQDKESHGQDDRIRPLTCMSPDYGDSLSVNIYII